MKTLDTGQLTGDWLPSPCVRDLVRVTLGRAKEGGRGLGFGCLLAEGWHMLLKCRALPPGRAGRRREGGAGGSLDPLPHNELAPCPAVCKGQSLQPNIAQFTRFLDSFPLYEKAPTQAARKLQKMLVVASGQTPPCPGVSPSEGQEPAGPGRGKHRRPRLWVASPSLPLQRPAPDVPDVRDAGLKGTSVQLPTRWAVMLKGAFLPGDSKKPPTLRIGSDS